MSENTRMDKLINFKWEYVIALLHFLISLAWRGKVYIGMEIPEEMLQDMLGDTQDILLFNIAAWIVSGLMILIFWHFLFFLFSDRCSKRFRLFFCTTFGILLILNILLFPNTYVLEADNLSVYTSVTMGRMDYWHSYFTSAVYLGTLFAFYHPVALPILQSAAWCGSYAFFYSLITGRTDNKYIKGLVWFGFFGAYLPFITMDPYRNCMYTILIFWFVMRIMAAYFGNEELSASLCMQLSAVGGVLAFWRSEGALYLILLPIILLVLYGKKELKKLLLVFVLMIAVYILGSVPQKVAVNKYYGSDYMMINVISMLSDALNDREFHSDYPGFEQDLAHVEAVYSAEVIRNHRAMAYQIGNYLKGYTDISRSLLSKQEQQEFISAALHIIWHNKWAVFKGRIHLMGVSIGLIPKDVLTTSNVDIQEFYNVIFSFGKIGWMELNEKLFCSADLNARIYTIIWTYGIEPYVSFGGHIQALAWLGCILASIIIAIDSLSCRELFWASIAWAILIMFAAIVVFAPEARSAYYYPTFYQMFALCLFYAVEFRGRLFPDKRVTEVQ